MNTVREQWALVGDPPKAKSVAAVAPVRDTATVFTPAVLVLIAAHVLLGLALEDRSAIGYMWFLAAVAAASGVVLFAPLSWVAPAIGYTAGTEVLWRALKLGVPWEASKYITVLLCLVAIIRVGRKVRVPLSPVVYFLLLLPSGLVLLADPRWDFGLLRRFFASGLAAPLALTLSVIAMSQLRLSPQDLRRAFLAYILPMLAMAAVTAVATYTDPDIVFTGESNSATSGGFGPNQVSTVLGLGALLAVLLAVWVETRPFGRFIATILALFLAAQSAMTFSRGGLYAAGAALAVGLTMSVKSSEARMRLVSIGFIALIAGLVIVPRLDDFTGGKLLARFSDTQATNRGGLMIEDLELFRENPVLGVGPAASGRSRTRFKLSASHTEYTRLLAEHGVFGGVALLVIIGGSFARLTRVSDPQQRAMTALFLTWAGLTMMHAAMRTVSPAFMTGLAWAHLASSRKT